MQSFVLIMTTKTYKRKYTKNATRNHKTDKLTLDKKINIENARNTLN